MAVTRHKLRINYPLLNKTLGLDNGIQIRITMRVSDLPIISHNFSQRYLRYVVAVNIILFIRKFVIINVFCPMSHECF